MSAPKVIYNRWLGNRSEISGNKKKSYLSRLETCNYIVIIIYCIGKHDCLKIHIIHLFVECHWPLAINYSLFLFTGIFNNKHQETHNSYTMQWMKQVVSELIVVRQAWRKIYNIYIILVKKHVYDEYDNYCKLIYRSWDVLCYK